MQSFWISLILALFFWIPGSPVNAQEEQPAGPVYVVQAGDSLWNIALRFGVTLDALQSANGITNPNQLTIGGQLVIPGLEGVRGMLVTEQVPLGESLRSLSRRFQVPLEALVRLNHLTSPAELYAGANLVIPQQSETGGVNRRAVLLPGQSVLELAVLHGVNPWTVVHTNALSSTWSAMAGDVLHLPGEQQAGPGALPEPITGLQVKSLPLVQGRPAVIHLSGSAGLSLSGTLAGHQLHFFSEKDGAYVALQGVHAMTEPGFYPLSITGKLPDGPPYHGASFAFSQAVFIRSGEYRMDPVLIVSPETIDPAVTKPEDAQWMALVDPVTPERLWDGKFQSPAPPPFSDCWPSVFGNRRSYNGSEYKYFHTGLDFCGGVGTEIHAPEAGTVVFAGPLTVRGNATMIDHGWGIYTAYMHQSEILVNPGDRVMPGQIIGLVGGTGRVTGPHLHWEVFVGGVQVDPMIWLEEAFP